MYHIAPFLNLATALNYVCADLQIIQHERSHKMLASPGHQFAHLLMQELISPLDLRCRLRHVVVQWLTCATTFFHTQSHDAKLDAQKCCTNQPGEGTNGARRTSHLAVWTRKTDFRTSEQNTLHREEKIHFHHRIVVTFTFFDDRTRQPSSLHMSPTLNWLVRPRSGLGSGHFGQQLLLPSFDSKTQRGRMVTTFACTSCRQDTHSQHTSVQYSLFTSMERIARA